VSAPVRESLLRILFQIEFSAVVSRHNGVFYAHAPQFNIWDCGDTINEAVEGALEGIVGMFEIVDERGNLKEYMADRGFRLRNGVYRTSQERRKKAESAYLSDVEWEKNDPDKGRKLFITVRLAKVSVVHEFAQPAPAIMWQHRYEETQIPQVAQAQR